MKRFLAYSGLTIMLLYLGVTQAGTNTHGKPFPPFRIAGNLYYVGDDYQADYLIVTPKGNILINSGYATDVPKIKASIKKLGFSYKDTKILLISHAHIDHDAGMPIIKRETGARYMVMAQDVPVVETGGKEDFFYGSDPSMLYQPTTVDRILQDGDKVTLGSTTLVAHLTAGHTKGCTTWTMKVSDKNQVYHVAIVCSPYLNPGYQLVNNAKYPNIAKDYERQFQVLSSLPVDIFLGAHGMYFNLGDKYHELHQGNTNAFIDPVGYKQFVSQKKQDFYKELSRQQSNKE